MPLIIHDDRKSDFVIESEVWHHKLRLFDRTTGVRVGSIDIGTTGLKTARACDLSMIPPYTITRELIESIKRWLIEVGGYERVVFERYKNGRFLERTINLQKGKPLYPGPHTEDR